MAAPVNIHNGGTGVAHTRNVSVWVNYHQVDVQRFGGTPCDGIDYGKTEGYIGDEYAVHDIEMIPIGLGCFEHCEVAVKVAEIGRK